MHASLQVDLLDLVTIGNRRPEAAWSQRRREPPGIAFAALLTFGVVYAIRDGDMPYRGAVILAIGSLAVAAYAYRQQKE